MLLNIVKINFCRQLSQTNHLHTWSRNAYMMSESRDLRSRSHDSFQRYRVSVDLDRLAGASILTIRKEATFGLRWRWYIRRLVERERIGGVLYISPAVSSGVSSRIVRRRFSDRAIASCARGSVATRTLLDALRVPNAMHGNPIVFDYF